MNSVNTLEAHALATQTSALKPKKKKTTKQKKKKINMENVSLVSRNAGLLQQTDTEH